MTICKPGDVIEVLFPFIDSASQKSRPALVLSSFNTVKGQKAVVLAMITSAKRSRWPHDVELSEWKKAGLRAPSTVRWKIFTLDAVLIIKKRGFISKQDNITISNVFRKVFPAFSDIPSVS